MKTLFKRLFTTPASINLSPVKGPSFPFSPPHIDSKVIYSQQLSLV